MREDKEPKTRLIFENYENRFIWESPYSDVTMDDILNAFYGMMIAATWQPETAISAMKDFAEEHGYLFEKDEEDGYDEDNCYKLKTWNGDNKSCCKIKVEGKEHSEEPRRFDGFQNPLPLNNENVLPKGCDITW